MRQTMMTIEMIINNRYFMVQNNTRYVYKFTYLVFCGRDFQSHFLKNTLQAIY